MQTHQGSQTCGSCSRAASLKTNAALQAEPVAAAVCPCGRRLTCRCTCLPQSTSMRSSWPCSDAQSQGMNSAADAGLPPGAATATAAACCELTGSSFNSCTPLLPAPSMAAALLLAATAPRRTGDERCRGGLPDLAAAHNEFISSRGTAGIRRLRGRARHEPPGPPPQRQQHAELPTFPPALCLLVELLHEITYNETQGGRVLIVGRYAEQGEGCRRAPGEWGRGRLPSKRD